jgi:DNA segregation ATPase FtsK/SpoIIIE-like protein
VARTRTRSTRANAEKTAPRAEKTRSRRAPRKTPTSRTERTRATEAVAAPLVPRRVRQLALIGVLLGSAYSTVALASWRATDPGYSTTGTGVVENVAGPVGAWIADILFLVMGYGAWAVAVVGVLAGLKVAGRSLGGWARLLAGASLLWTAQTALALVLPADPAAGGFPAGGLIGEGSAQTLVELVGPAGAWIVLLGVAMVGATYATRIDWSRVFGAAVGRAEQALPVVGRVGKQVGQGAFGQVRRAGAAVAEGLRVRSAEAEVGPGTEWEDPGSEYGWDDPEPSFPPEFSEGPHPDAVGLEGAAGIPGDAIDFQREPAPEPGVAVAPQPAAVRPAPVASAPVAVPRSVALGIPGPAAFEPAFADDLEDRTQVAARSLVEVEWESTQHTGAVPSRREDWETPARAPITPASVASAAPVVVRPEPAPVADEPARRTVGAGAWPPALRPSVAEGPPADGAVAEDPVPVHPAEHEDPPSRLSDADRISQALEAPAPASMDRAAHTVAPAQPEPVAAPAPEVAPSVEPVARPSNAFAGDLPPLAAQDAPSPRLRPAPRRAGAIQVDPDALVSGGDDAGGKVVIDHANDADFELPHLGLLDTHERSVARIDEEALRLLGETLEAKLNDFGVKGEVVAIRPGPVITTFEYLPAPGIKLSKITALEDDIAMALKALRVRIVAPIPGKGVVGFEVPNKKRQIVWVRDMLASERFRSEKRALPMILGKNVEGKPEIGDLAKAPHLLVAGTTGSGKSVGVNAMLLSMLYTRTPDELRLILIDPKMLEFELYQDIPHLLHPVVTDPALANAALKWACAEMDDRYRLLAKWKTRNIASYNKKVEQELKDWTPAKARQYAPVDWPRSEPPPTPRKLPYIVIVIDELADLMMIAAKEVEVNIARIAQKARAAGIHLIVATQRPEKQVVTGIIKANMPSRIAFQVRSKLDGRIILDQGGAESLLGKGDMLFLPPGTAELVRCHGPFVADEEVRRVCDFLRDQGAPNYEAEIRVEQADGSDLTEEDYDEFYDEAVNFILEEGKASTSMVQRRFKIGYNRAARIIDVMEREGVVGPADGARPRKVLVGNHAMGT